MINLKTQKLNQRQKMNKQTKTFDRMSFNHTLDTSSWSGGGFDGDGSTRSWQKSCN